MPKEKFLPVLEKNHGHTYYQNGVRSQESENKGLHRKKIASLRRDSHQLAIFGILPSNPQDFNSPGYTHKRLCGENG